MSAQPFQKLLIANRGEIALRILRAATELKVRTVAIYSHEDRFALYRFKADEAYKVGEEGKPIDAYLKYSEIIKLAQKIGVDAIHPGYGFLSENAEFAQACQDAGICFVGPGPKLLDMFGDKVKARQIAKEAQIPVIPGGEAAIPDIEACVKQAAEMGYPVTLKAVSGGGGKGIRMITSESQLREEFERAQSEAMTSFGRADIYLEKTIEAAKHIEVQILGDQSGHIVHLYERDCSVQRRNQKIIEVAPAIGISEGCRKRLCDYAIKIAHHIQYQGLGTVEFLVDHQENPYFLEVNPRVQVEHTITEMITGIDLVQASILVASGVPLADKRIGINGQDSIEARGAAIQCRITTENPAEDFAPDTGTIIAYRPACGFGIRLDEGQATTGGVITPHYDSLLVKVSAWGRDFEGAVAKIQRSLNEFRIRGIKHNLPLLKNVVNHPQFKDMTMTTNFLQQHPEVMKTKPLRDRATKVLRFIAEATVNNPHGFAIKRIDMPRLPAAPRWQDPQPVALRSKSPNAKEVFDQHGWTGLKAWLRDQKQLLLTDTTMRDAHQSLFATRLRTRDIMVAAEFYRQHCDVFFSLEVWGGATFDTCLRFLKEDPWERLASIRKAIPNALLQMLIRGDNAVGYTNYPEWVIRDFIRLSAQSGLDVFRIFDCLNQPRKMQIAIDEVLKRDAIAEVCICYTGNLADHNEQKYTLNYYTNLAQELAKMGAQILCIKDMAGLLRPEAASILIDALKQKVDLPIHLHTHDTSGVGVTMLTAAAQSGCDIVDCAVSSMSGFTSQPSLNALIVAMGGDPRCPQVNLEMLDHLSRYWEAVRSMYSQFDPGIRSTSTEVYRHEIPGGQYSNLYDQARKVGVSTEEFYELTQRYQEVNQLLGNIVKVTPSSKVVGDFALLLQKQKLSGPQWLEQRPQLDYPDSVLSFFKGHMGEPLGGFNEQVRSLVLGQNAPPPQDAPIGDSDDFAQVKHHLEATLGATVSDFEVLSYRLYPKVFMDYCDHIEHFGRVDHLTTPVFFYGLRQGLEIETDLEPGKTLIIELSGISEANEKGMRTVFFQLNGFPRSIEIRDLSIQKSTSDRPKGNSREPGHIIATMPSKVIDVKVQEGDSIQEAQVLIITEAMKMEYAMKAKCLGKVEKVYVKKGDQVESGDLLLEID